MGVEHSVKDEDENTIRCPGCLHVSTCRSHDDFGPYFYCQNPKCDVEIIYDVNTVMMSGCRGR